MSNEQTYILLKQMIERLKTAVDDADSRMPEGAERESVRQHEAEGCPGLLCMNQAHYKSIAGEAVALAPVRALIQEWEGDAALLAPSSSS